VLASLVTVMLSVLWGVLALLLDAGFDALELREARLNVERVRESFADQMKDVCARTVDWSMWDDTWNFARGKNSGYVESNLANVSFGAMNLSALVITNGEGKVIAAVEQKDPADTHTQPLAQSVLTEHFAPSSALVTRPLRSQQPTSGLVFTAGHPPLVVCSLPITKSDGSGEPAGTLTFGRYFDEGRRVAMQKSLRMPLRFVAPGEPDHAATAAGHDPLSPILLAAKGDDVMEGYTAFADLDGQAHLWAKLSMPRAIKAQAIRSMRAVLWSVGGIGLLFGVAMVVFLERAVLRRLSAISRSVTTITESFQFTERVPPEGSDEIGVLARAINGLLSACEQAMSSLEMEQSASVEGAPREES